MGFKKGTSNFHKSISIISILTLIFWNSFFVYADQLKIVDVEKKWSVLSINNQENKVSTSLDDHHTIEEIDIFHDHDHENHEDLWKQKIEKFVSWEKIEIEWILEMVIWEWPNGYMEETYILYDDSYWKTFTLDLNNVIDDKYVWSRVVLHWDDWNIFKVEELLSNQSVLATQLSVAEFTPESKNIRNVAVFMVEVNGQSPIWTKETSEVKIFWDTNSAKEYFKETSYWELEINSDADQNGKNDIFWPFNVDGAWKCEYSTWRSQSVQQANALGIDTSKYHNIILILPNYSRIWCNWAWLWNVWSVNAQYTTYSWIAYNSNSVVQHELGHNYGMWHSSTDPDNNWSVNSEYWDQSGVMGGPAWMPLKIWVNAPHLDQLNWWDHIEWYYEFVNEPVNNYILQPLQLDPDINSWTRIVKFPKKNNNEYYYVSYRQPVWYNAQMYSKYQPGLMIHTYRWSWYSNTKLVKTLNNWEEFYDATNNIRITSQWLDQATGWMKVMIETNPWTCVKWEMSVFKLVWSNIFQTNQEWKLDFRVVNNDLDCGKQKIDFSVNQDNQVSWNFTPTSLDLHPQDFKDISFIFNTWNQDGEKNYSLTANDNDWVNPDHGSFSFTGSIIVDGTVPLSVNNLSYNKVWSIYNFTWSKSTDNLSWVDKYEVYRDTGSWYELYRNVYSPEEWNVVWFTETDLWALQYDYKVHVIDNAWNISAQSNIVTIDNSQWTCVFNWGELILNSKNISTNTGSIHNLTYTLTNKNINCNDVNYSLTTSKPDDFVTILDKTNVMLPSWGTSTWVLQVTTSNLPWEYQVILTNTSQDYTDNNKNISLDTVVNFYLQWEYITKPTNFSYIKNWNNYWFTWSWSTYTSIWWEWWDTWWSENNREKENNVIYELYRSNSDNFDEYNLIYSWTTTWFTDILFNEKQYKYYVIWTNGQWIKSEKSNVIDIDFSLPENITWEFIFNSWSFVNNRNTKISLNSSVFPVKYYITWDVSKTWSINMKEDLDITLSNTDWLKILNLQYFWNNWKSKIISNSITLDTVNPVFNLITDISWTGTIKENINLEWTVSDLNGIKSFQINNEEVVINNWNWSKIINLSLWENLINYSLTDNANNTLIGNFTIKRIITPEIEDNIPNDFSFSARNNAQLNTEYISNNITITWINTGSTVVVNNWSYSINNSDFTTNTWVIFNNSNLKIKWVSSSDYNKSTIINIVVWWISKDFIITTKSKPRSGWGWGGWWNRKPKVICEIDKHLVCESNRKWVYKYYKKPWVVCIRWDLWKPCNITSNEEDEKEKEYSHNKKLLLNNWSLKNNNIDSILWSLEDVDLDKEFIHKNINDYSDSKIKKIFLLNKSRFDKMHNKLDQLLYLSNEFKKYQYYLGINYSELNIILEWLEESKKEENKSEILKYYREYKILNNNIKSINNIFLDIWKIKYKEIWNNESIAYFKYKDKLLRKQQAILSIKMKRKEFNWELFKDINTYLHNQYILINQWISIDFNNDEYKIFLDRIKNL